MGEARFSRPSTISAVVGDPSTSIAEFVSLSPTSPGLSTGTMGTTNVTVTACGPVHATHQLDFMVETLTCVCVCPTTGANRSASRNLGVPQGNAPTGRAVD